MRGTNGRLALGNKALRIRWWGRGTDKPQREEGRGSKRSAKSEAEEEGGDRTRGRLFKPPPKRARDLVAGHKHGNMARSLIWDGYSISQLWTGCPGITRL